MKYSLRSLMIVVTLACVVSAIAGRSYYLHRMAVFHGNEGLRIGLQKRASLRDEISGVISFAQHLELAKRYRAAVWRPWTIVDTQPPEIDRTELDLLAKQIEDGRA